MTNNITKIVAYGTEVSADTEMDKLRKTRCLCLSGCEYMDTDCDIAKSIYDICKTHDMAMMITRCKKYSAKKEE